MRDRTYCCSHIVAEYIRNTCLDEFISLIFISIALSYQYGLAFFSQFSRKDTNLYLATYNYALIVIFLSELIYRGIDFFTEFLMQGYHKCQLGPSTRDDALD